MAHLSSDEITRIAEKLEYDEVFSRFEEQVIRHLQICPICRDRIGEALNALEKDPDLSRKVKNKPDRE
ncbi:MAG: hypothetical protein IJ899_16170 [Blautia sp.]|nr:hypothetical protein [Blautia sp.]